MGGTDADGSEVVVLAVAIDAGVFSVAMKGKLNRLAIIFGGRTGQFWVIALKMLEKGIFASEQTVTPRGITAVRSSASADVSNINLSLGTSHPLCATVSGKRTRIGKCFEAMLAVVRFLTRAVVNDIRRCIRKKLTGCGYELSKLISG